MKIIQKDPIYFLSYIENDKVFAGASTRKSGFSAEPYYSLNLGINTNDNQTSIEQNRNLFFSTISPSFSVAFLNQTHSTIIHHVDDHFQNGIIGDGLITTRKNKLLAATIADCGSVCFYDDDYSVIGIIHAGWKGTLDGIVEEMCLQLSKYRPINTFSAVIGPMIQKENYEVGAEFRDFFGKKFLFESKDKLYFDLNGCIEDKLRNAGLSKITNEKIDTYTNPEHFFSHRRDKTTGRMLAFIGLKYI